jgi:hypothetical protein
MPKCIDCGRWVQDGKPCICEVEDGHCKECGVHCGSDLCTDCAESVNDYQDELLED